MAWDDYMITIYFDDQIVVNQTHSLWLEIFYIGGIVGVLRLIYYVVVIPLRVFQPEKYHHWLLTLAWSIFCLSAQ